jgi:hypothetical protein
VQCERVLRHTPDPEAAIRALGDVAAIVAIAGDGATADFVVKRSGVVMGKAFGLRDGWWGCRPRRGVVWPVWWCEIPVKIAHSDFSWLHVDNN